MGSIVQDHLYCVAFTCSHNRQTCSFSPIKCSHHCPITKKSSSNVGSDADSSHLVTCIDFCRVRKGGGRCLENCKSSVKDFLTPRPPSCLALRPACNAFHYLCIHGKHLARVHDQRGRTDVGTSAATHFGSPQGNRHIFRWTNLQASHENLSYACLQEHVQHMTTPHRRP
jgi:hypothetical protein